MAYSSRCQRSKRRRTRKLHRFENRIQNDKAAVSSREDASSNCVTFDDSSNHSSGNDTSLAQKMIRRVNDPIPDSIFFDNDRSRNTVAIEAYDNDVVERNENESETSSVMEDIKDMEEVDIMLNYNQQGSVDDKEDDRSINSSSTGLTKEGGSLDGQVSSVNIENSRDKHQFWRVSRNEIACYEIMILLDSTGAPRYLYNKLVTLLRKLTKSDGFDVKKAVTRETLMDNLSLCKKRPGIKKATIHKQEVFRFSFVDMLQDLLHSVGSDDLHTIVPQTPQEDEGERPSCPAVDDKRSNHHHELWNTAWMEKTFAMNKYNQFDSQKDIMLPLILYMDKTGTDVNQRYCIEPILFTFSAIPRAKRENRHSWRHLGFVPQRSASSIDQDISSSSPQVYHDYLEFLLEGVREAQHDPPTVFIRTPTGEFQPRRALLPLMIIMGDQLSQDTLCGRLKSNSGGAGRVHRSCMCSYLHIDNPYHECKRVDISVLSLLSSRARKTDEDIANELRDLRLTAKEKSKLISYQKKQRTMYQNVLRHPFTTHAIKNAFDNLDFGSWSNGIHDATFDDFMHSVEAGMIAYIAEAVYGGLVKKEQEKVEELTRALLDNQRCSVSGELPRMRLQSGFSRQTLMTSGERVGSLLALCLSLQEPTIRRTMNDAHERQAIKYVDVSDTVAEESEEDGGKTEKKKKPTKEGSPEFYLNYHMHTMDDEESLQTVKHTLEHMIRHGFPAYLLDILDPFQTNQLIRHCTDSFHSTSYPESYPPNQLVILGKELYSDLGPLTRSTKKLQGKEPIPLYFEKGNPITKEQVSLVAYAVQTKPEKLIDSHRRRQVQGTTPKHLLRKANKKGEGATAAVLTSDMATLTIFLEYVLCFHAFCNYSSDLPLFLQKFHDNIMNGNRFMMEYFQKIIYRGNCTVDSRFPKIHSQYRMGLNTIELNTVMNFSCETGERLLKTEAKGISRTSQQRGNDTFVKQTMSRIQDRCLLDSFGEFLQEKKTKEDNKKNKTQQDIAQKNVDRPSRIHPHFIYDVDTDVVMAVDRFNQLKPPDKDSGFIERTVLEALKQNEPGMRKFEIYNEVILRNNSYVRASPNYAKSGSWYDYANIVWHREDIQPTQGKPDPTYHLPAKCLCFYRTVSHEESDPPRYDYMALIHSVDIESVGKFKDRKDTLLTRHYRMEYQENNKPRTHVVDLGSIDKAIRCFPHSPNNGLFITATIGITYVLPRSHWPYVWMATNQCLEESNSIHDSTTRNKKLNPLCQKGWLDYVRETYRKYYNATSIENLQVPVDTLPPEFPKKPPKSRKRKRKA